MTILDFIAKWKKADLKERSAAQEHFIDLCRCLGHPTPAEADPTGASFCFEKGAAKQGGGEGFADVWKQGFFGWEYKGRHQNLDAAYDQLLRYRDALASPPLLVVCDLDRIIVHTNFTGTVSAAHELALDRLDEPRSLEILRAVFHDPEKLRPGTTSTAITQDAARRFADIAAAMRRRGLDPAAVAHFLDRVVFCLFAEDIGLLPDMIFTRIVEKAAGDPDKVRRFLGQLFEAMGTGGEFGLESIRRFNGNLFDNAAVPVLTADDVQRIADTARMDWSAVDPSIFGTLFERGLDPAKRAQLGAHFTSKQDIEILVEAIVMVPFRREWAETRAVIATLLATGRKCTSDSRLPAPSSPLAGPRLRKARQEAGSLVHRFLARLQVVKVLDPACGSGNFLYVTLQKLKDLEKDAILFSMDKGLGAFLPLVGPWQLYGLEVNPYAHDLAQMTVWIGWLQWIRVNGFGSPQDPILRPMEANFRRMDAILDQSDPANPKEPDWPRVDFIVGNPPFLGDKFMRRELGDAYVDRLRALYAERIPGQSDLCCYWFEKARAHIEKGGCKRAGLLATQGIRGGANREVLKRIKQSGDIFWAESDRPWILDGANVHVSMVGFDAGIETNRTLDGKLVPMINANLTSAADVAKASPIPENAGIGFIGVAQKAPFDLSLTYAINMLNDCNPHRRPNSDVLVPIRNAMDITQRLRDIWNIDFGIDTPEAEAALYEKPFSLVVAKVRPLRATHREPRQEKYWWLFARPCPDMRAAIAGLSRFAATPRVSKHRIIVWLNPEMLCDSAVVAFARSDDLFFGILHSRFHEVWALRMGTRLETRPRYTPTTCFETFPFPPGVLTPCDPAPAAHAAIAAAAKELNALRETWLNPPEWTRVETLEFPGTVGGPWSRYIVPGTERPLPIPDSRLPAPVHLGTVRYPRLVARDAACAARLKERTLTKLYNARPAWLADCHARLDAAVAAAYGWPADMTDEGILERLLALNVEPARREGKP